MTRPTPADYREAKRGGIKVAICAAIGMILMLAAWRDGHDGIAVLAAVVTIVGVLAEGRPKAARARRRYGR